MNQRLALCLLLIVALFVTAYARVAPLSLPWNEADVLGLFATSDALFEEIRDVIYADSIVTNYRYHTEILLAVPGWYDVTNSIEQGINGANTRGKLSAATYNILKYYSQCTRNLVRVVEDTNLAIHDRLDLFSVAWQSYEESKRRALDAHGEMLSGADPPAPTGIAGIGLDEQNAGSLLIGHAFERWDVNAAFVGDRFVVGVRIASVLGGRDREPGDSHGVGMLAGPVFGRIALLPGADLSWEESRGMKATARFTMTAAYWRQGLSAGATYTVGTGFGVLLLYGW